MLKQDNEALGIQHYNQAAYIVLLDNYLSVRQNTHRSHPKIAKQIHEDHSKEAKKNECQMDDGFFVGKTTNYSGRADIYPQCAKRSASTIFGQLFPIK